ncbi:MAG: hypothetical protein ACI9GB_001809, partial [Halioglobus sp.]
MGCLRTVLMISTLPLSPSNLRFMNTTKAVFPSDERGNNIYFAAANNHYGAGSPDEDNVQSHIESDHIYAYPYLVYADCHWS